MGASCNWCRARQLKLAFDDFEYWIGRFSHYPLVQLIDLDAAMRQGENAALIDQIAGRLPCQVGGGIATVEKATAVLSAGARRVIVGSALFGGADAGEYGVCPGAGAGGGRWSNWCSAWIPSRGGLR